MKNDDEQPAVDLGEYYEDPVDFLRAVMNGVDIDLEMRMNAAKILAGVLKPARRVETVYKGQTVARLEAVDSDNVFASATMPMPKRAN